MDYRSYTMTQLVTELNDQWIGYLDNKAARESVWVEPYMAAIEALAAEVDRLVIDELHGRALAEYAEAYRLAPPSGSQQWLRP